MERPDYKLIVEALRQAAGWIAGTRESESMLHQAALLEAKDAKEGGEGAGVERICDECGCDWPLGEKECPCGGVTYSTQVAAASPTPPSAEAGAVAWLYEYEEDGLSLCVTSAARFRESWIAKHKATERPLYTHAAPAGDAQDTARLDFVLSVVPNSELEGWGAAVWNYGLERDVTRADIDAARAALSDRRGGGANG